MKLIPGIVPALGMATLIAACHKEQGYQKPLVPVKVQAVQQSQVVTPSRFSGNVQPSQQVLVAFRVGDYVASLMQLEAGGGHTRDIQEGDRVTKGAVLARLRETTYAARVKQVESQLAEAQAALQGAQALLSEAETTRDQAKRDFDRASMLFESRSVTRPEFDAAKTRLDVVLDKVKQASAQVSAVTAKIAQANAGLQEARTALEDCSLRAPITGTVLKQMITPGSLVAPGTVSFVLADTSSVKVVFAVPDRAMPKLKVGNRLAMTSEGVPGVELSGRISRISPTADPKSRLFDFETTIPNESGLLKVGMVVSLQVGEEAPVSPMVVPLSAVVRSGRAAGSYGVFVVGGDHVARLREVKLGPVFGNSIEAASGLKTGDQVVVAGASIVADGESVRIIP